MLALHVNNSMYSCFNFRAKNLKFVAVITFSLLFSSRLLSQSAACTIKIDSTVVFKKAKLRGIYWQRDWFCPPKIKLDTLTCTWLFSSCRTRHSNWGDCKNTNGCTVWISAQILVDAQSGKVVSCKREKKRYHNYE